MPVTTKKFGNDEIPVPLKKIRNIIDRIFSPLSVSNISAVTYPKVEESLNNVVNPMALKNKNATIDSIRNVLKNAFQGAVQFNLTYNSLAEQGLVFEEAAEFQNNFLRIVREAAASVDESDTDVFNEALFMAEILFTMRRSDNPITYDQIVGQIHLSLNENMRAPVLEALSAEYIRLGGLIP